MTPNYRIGLLGASKIAPKAIIAPALKRKDCEIVALACRDVHRGQNYAHQHGLPQIDIMEDYASLCAREDIDIIYNALPPSHHLETAHWAMGKVQLIEKPFAMNADEAAQMAALPGVLMEAFHHHYHPAFVYFLKQIDQIRPLTRMEGRFHVTIPDKPGEIRHSAELGGGSLMDLGTYPLQIARTIAGRDPRIVQARAIEGNPRIDLFLEAELDFGDGLVATISSDMSPGIQRVNFFDVEGAGGSVRMDNPVHPYRGCTITTPSGTVTDETHPKWRDVTTYDAQLAHLLTHLGMGLPPLTDANAAVKQMLAIDAIYRTTGLGPR